MAAPSTNLERRGAYFHSLSKALTNESQYAFESKYKSSHSVSYEEIWADVIPYLETQQDVDNFIVNNQGIIKKYTEVELTEIPGSNGQAWYINDNKFIKPFISPVDVMDKINGLPSSGFEAQLFTNTNTRISPTAGVWFVDYYAGIVHFEIGKTPNDLGYGVPKLTVYSYIGRTVKDIIDNINKQNNSTEIVTTERIYIIDNKITLPFEAKGDIIQNSAFIFDGFYSEYFTEYSCTASSDGLSVLFDPLDNLNGKFATVSYLTDKGGI